MAATTYGYRRGKRNQVSKLKGLVGLSNIKSNEAIRLNNLNPRTSILLSGLREKQAPAFMFCAEWQDWERTVACLGRPPPCCACTLPSRALMADYGNEKYHPEDNTSFNPEAELNNTDGTRAFKCLFEGLIVFSQDFSCQKFFLSFFFYSQ